MENWGPIWREGPIWKENLHDFRISMVRMSMILENWRFGTALQGRRPEKKDPFRAGRREGKEGGERKNRKRGGRGAARTGVAIAVQNEKSCEFIFLTSGDAKRHF
jgi:hypothetical protein